MVKAPVQMVSQLNFINFFWHEIKDFLINSLVYHYNQDELSITQKEGIITLIPKKDKDTLLIKNWRPITLLNQDYKLATKAIAKRLCNVLPSIINSNQTGFLKNRYIGENILNITNLMDYLDDNNEAAILLSADFEKAFDCLEWDFIEYCLNQFNFGQSLKKWIKVFYTGIITRISNNGWVTEMFYPTRGSRQGCPLSPYICIICAEFLACLIRNNDNIEGIRVNDGTFLVSQYADDTLITLKYNVQNLRNTIETFNLFTKFSGLKVNYDKSEIMPLGCIQYNYIIIAPESGIRWTEGPIKSLGIELCHRTEDLLKLNYTKSLEKMCNIIRIWEKRYLTPYGKVIVINSFIISQFVYLMSVLPAPPDQLSKQINTLIYRFLWNNKPDKVKRDIMKLPKQMGGLSVPDIVAKNTALKTAWVQRIVRKENYWNIWIYNKIPIKSELFWHCNLNKQDAIYLARNIPNALTKEIIESWFSYSFYVPTKLGQIYYQIIWLNSHIKVENKILFNKHLYDQNIIHIHQFFDNQGTILRLNDFQVKYNIEINYLIYYSIISAIPNNWKQIIRSQIAAPVLPLSHKPLQIINQRKNKICQIVYIDIVDKLYGQTIASGFENGTNISLGVCH